MLGGGKFPGSVEENQKQCDNTRLTELQLVGHVPIQCGGAIGMINYVGNEHAPTNNRPIKRAREEEPVNMPQKLGVSLNNNVYQDEHGHIGTLLNPNPVSAGLRLFCEKKERSSSVTSTCENMKNALPGVLSLVVNRKMHEKELEIENISRKNKELEDGIKQVTMEAQSWHNRAKYNESVANVLKSNIQQIMAQGPAQGREGYGDNEVDDAVSCMNRPGIISSRGNQEFEENHRLKCRACKSKQVSVLLFPCRHLCLCADCEGFIDVCPICQVMKTASFLVYM
ncbi:hypothetical protein DH2020_012937 [Rehmannia glutinosa]|uniref:RING-type domain-containing protein n=1 Tax=Rehmannia glutinosa TaxID=99300 RepID=A0ABR0X0S4_REHGL